MNMYRAFSRIFMGFFVLSLLSITSAAAVVATSAGKVIATEGTVNALNNQMQKRTVKRGDNFFVEDTIETAEKSVVALRFTDGTLLELKEKSSFKIREYQFKPQNPDEDSYSAELIKGGFRTITGALGKRNPDHYEVKARTTTLTIRGTKVLMDIVPSTSEVEGMIDPMDVQVGLLDGAASVQSGGSRVDLMPNTNAIVNANGNIVAGTGIPREMFKGYSSEDINTLIQKAAALGFSENITPPDDTVFIEGEGTTKPPEPVGGSSPCEGITGMSSAMP